MLLWRKLLAENSRLTSLQRVALRRVVSLSSCYFLQKPLPQKDTGVKVVFQCFSWVGTKTKWGGLGLPRPPMATPLTRTVCVCTVCFVYLLRDSPAWIVSKRELDSNFPLVTVATRAHWTREKYREEFRIPYWSSTHKYMQYSSLGAADQSKIADRRGLQL